MPYLRLPRRATPKDQFVPDGPVMAMSTTMARVEDGEGVAVGDGGDGGVDGDEDGSTADGG